MTTRAPAHRVAVQHLKFLIKAVRFEIYVLKVYRDALPSCVRLSDAIHLAERYTLTPRRSRPAGPKAGREQAGK